MHPLDLIPLAIAVALPLLARALLFDDDRKE